MHPRLELVLEGLRQTTAVLRAGGGDHDSSARYLLDYLRYADDLQYGSEADLRTAVAVLRDHMEAYASLCSPVYGKGYGILDKGHLRDKSSWYVPYQQGQQNRTSGTTSDPFEYLIWGPALLPLEQEHHYRAVLREHRIPDCGTRVLHVLPGHMGRDYRREGILRLSTNGTGPMWGHGAYDPRVVHVLYPGDCYQDPDAYIDAVLEYALGQDVLCAGGEFLHMLAAAVRRRGITERYVGLVSNTTGMALTEDLRSLVSSGFAGAWCDHMRCWDGGATFLTCGSGRYHVLDHLCWVESDDGRLISTDFFNLASPFVRYWNGDHALVGSEYSRCDCGRLYRDFQFQHTRAFVAKGRGGQELSSEELAARVQAVPGAAAHWDGQPGQVTISSTEELDPELKRMLAESLSDFDLEFDTRMRTGELAPLPQNATSHTKTYTRSDTSGS